MSDLSSIDQETVLARTREWLEKAVIGLNLCPFAKAVYVKNQVRIVISEARHVDTFLEDFDRELTFLAATDPEIVDTTLLVHPSLLADFEDFNAVVGIAEEAVEEQELEGVIQVASFHPSFQFADTELDDLGNYTNRSPYPTIHLIREASIERAVAGLANPDEIYERNIRTMESLGLDGLAKLGICPVTGKK